jgi:hypothetical protein
MNARSRSVLASLLVATLGACAERLATLPPSDRYQLSTDTGTPKLTGDQKEFVDRVNKELAKYGETATPGNYEMQLAALTADIRLSKGWHGSGSKVADERATPGATGAVAVPDGGAGGYLYPVSDEPDDRQSKSIHWDQRFYAHGVHPDFAHWSWTVDYARHEVEDDALEKAVLDMHPLRVLGKLKIGVAMVPNGGDNQRIFTLVIRDERILLSEAPPRQPAPGATFVVSGQIVDQTLSAMKLGLLGPDGQIVLNDVTASEDGRFSTTVQVPNTTGRWIMSLNRVVGTSGGYRSNVLTVPLFVGVSPTPWPIWAAPQAEPPDSARTYAKALAQAINDYRTAHGLPPLPVPADLSKASRGLVMQYAQAWGPARKGDPAMIRVMVDGPEKSPFGEAGFDHALLFHQSGCLKDEDIPRFQANFPQNAVRANAITLPEAQQIGVGVARVPQADSEDDNVFCGVWVIQNRPTPPAEVIPAAAAPPTPSSVPPSKTEKTPDQPASPSPEPANPPTPVAAPATPAAPTPASPTPK